MTAQILLVEDDVKLASLVSVFLSKHDMDIACEVNGEAAIEKVRTLKPDLVILDIMLPGLDGLTVCRKLREFYSGVIIMLTALNDDIDEVAGLEMGADGYLGKPIKPRVLLAHIRAHLRRQFSLRDEPEADKAELIQTQEITIDPSRREVSRGNNLIPLTSAEFELLWLLAQNKGNIISREKLHNMVFHLEYDGIDRNIDIRVSRLRRKLGDDPRDPKIIKTVRGQGYILAE